MFKRLWSVPVLTVAFAALALLAPQASAADKTPGPSRDRKHMEKFVAKLEKELALTPAQSAQVREILRPDSMLPPPGAMREGMPEGKRGPGPKRAHNVPLFGDEFLAQLRADKVDTAALNRAFAERAANMQKYHERHVSKFVQLHDVLTPAQRAKLAEILEKRRAK
jgi:Spy/CpxP family protein refolding chaperone